MAHWCGHQCGPEPMPARPAFAFIPSPLYPLNPPLHLPPYQCSSVFPLLGSERRTHAGLAMNRQAADMAHDAVGTWARSVRMRRLVRAVRCISARFAAIHRVSNADVPSAADRPQPNQSKDRAGVSGRRYRAGSANSKGNRKQRKKRKSRACMARAPDLRRCRCNLRFCVICGSLSLLRCDTPRAMTLAGKGSGETARYGQCIGK